MSEPIVINRNRIVIAKRLYTSGRGDYILYEYRGRLYRVHTPQPELITVDTPDVKADEP